jgi:uncharacterized protein
MPALRQSLKSPVPYLVALLLTALLAGFDATRDPSRQATASLWVSGVRIYQRLGRPLLEGRVVCRYVPTCSEYSIEAVERRGIGSGLALAVRRLSRCKRSVHPGTLDPVPMTRPV